MDYGPSSYPTASQQTNTMAIVSLVFGILGLIGACPGLGSIIAVVTGNMAQREIRENPAQYTGDGLAKAGIIMGWIGIVLTVLAICAFIAYFAFIFAVVGSSGEFSGIMGWLLF